MDATPKPEPRWLSATEQRAWRGYLMGVATLSDALNRVLQEEFDLTLGEYELMVRLSESADHSLRMSQLANELVHSRSRVTYSVRTMEQRGLVRRRAAQSDGRGVTCHLTEQGWELLQEAAKAHVASVREYFVDVVGPTTMRVIGEAMGRVAEHAGLRTELEYARLER